MPAPKFPRAKLVKRFPLPDGCDLSWIEIRETGGTDEKLASIQLEAKGPKESTMTAELIALAIVAYLPAAGTEADQVRVTDPPDYAFEDWNSRTRSFVVAFFESINGTSRPELVASMLAGKIVAGAEPAVHAPTSSDGGPSTAAPSTT